ncbi:hypothetical protein [Micromonospora gifhornensis]|uniref:Acyl-CoA dehydrogenase n=1 Tax=Verrucosispora sp. MS100047 TaxID=1410949 RepID=A0A097CS66_9ACTN|nr:hypothetical protein VASRM7_249 [Verrucosispora sp. MS100047]
MTITVSTPATAADLRRYRTLAYTAGAVTALGALHADTSPGVVPVGPGGHTFLPAAVYAASDRCATPDGPRPQPYGQTVLDRVVTSDGELIAWRVPDGGPDPDTGAAWTTGIAWIRLGLTTRLLDLAAAHLRGRTVAGVVTLNLPMVRGILADAATGIAEAQALLDTRADLHQVHRALDETGRSCLHLFGAAGFLTDGPGSHLRVSELLADTYPPPHEEAP